MMAQVPDIPRLEERLDAAQSALARAERTMSTTEHASLQREFDDLSDDLTYLRVKTRRGERVSDSERRDLSERIDRFIHRADDRGRATATPGQRAIPVGTEIDVRLQTPLNSGTAQVEQRVEATTMVNLYQGDDLLLPAGALLVGHVAAVDRASRGDRKGSIALSFTRLTTDGDTHDVRVSVTQALESEGLKGEAGRIGAGAGVGAILGGILGGVKGAITGILIGGGGVLVATEGKDVELPTGTVLRVRFDSAVPLVD
ncbi:MAG: hypothetical protein R2712_16980 [Vicinamibacterales bacterium]